MDFNKFFQSKGFQALIIILVIIIIALVSFQLGLMVGFRKAGFSYRWEENYHRNFAGPAGGFMDDWRGRDFIESSGIFGQVIKIDGDKIIIRGKDNVEKIILVTANTVIRRFQEDLPISALQVDDALVIIGDPNDAGQIEAKLIRVMPAPPAPKNPQSNSSSTDFGPPPIR